MKMMQLLIVIMGSSPTPKGAGYFFALIWEKVDNYLMHTYGNDCFALGSSP